MILMISTSGWLFSDHVNDVLIGNVNVDPLKWSIVKNVCRNRRDLQLNYNYFDITYYLTLSQSYWEVYFLYANFVPPIDTFSYLISSQNSCFIKYFIFYCCSFNHNYYFFLVNFKELLILREIAKNSFHESILYK